MRRQQRSADAKDELASEMTALAQSMSVGSLRQLIELDLGRANSARPVELDNALERPTTALATAVQWMEVFT